MTEKLFYEDSHMMTFSAIVTACEKVGDYYEAVLNRTAFFPEGGGQYADTGMLGEAIVSDVQEKKDIIYHKINRPLSVGQEVIGKIDWEERFSKMQQHSGEHIVSGLIHAAFGYDNVGFHMGTDAITMDFNGILTKEQLKEIEYKANEAVARDLEIQVTYPSKEALQQMEYRSKIEIEGQVRIVTIPGYDVCACCAPHVKKTGEIGMIKLVGLQNYKGGVRVSMLCGFRALADYNEKAEQVKKISVLLSAKENEVFEEVEKLKSEIAVQKNKVFELERKLLQYKVEELPREEIVIVFETELSGNAPREMMNLILQKDEVKVAAIFAGNDEEGYRYVIGSRVKDTREIVKHLNQAFQGRGGGKPEMVQGQVCGTQMAIREVLQGCVTLED